MDLALASPDVLRLELGEPNLSTPTAVLEAAARAARDGYTKYTVSQGAPSLRQVISENLARRTGVVVDPDRVVVTVGGVGAVSLALFTLLDPSDEVLIPDMGWPTYGMMAKALGATPVFYPLHRSKRYEPDLNRLAALVRSPRAKVLVINTPSNPTGAVWRSEVIEQTLEIARMGDLYVLSDEVYDQIIFQGEHVSPLGLDQDDRVLSVFSLSKTYAMTGWRIGYLVPPQTLTSLLIKMQEVTVSCANSIAQKAAEAALNSCEEWVAVAREHYRERRDLAVFHLQEAGLLVSEPQGTFYILADVSRATQDTFHFARRFITEYKVAVAPGETFGPAGAGLVRLSLAVEGDVIREGITRLARAVSDWSSQASSS